MVVTHHIDAAALLLHARPFLEKAEAENALLLGLCASPPAVTEAPLWLSVDSESGPVAVAIRTPPFNLLLSRAPDPALAVMVEDLNARNCRLPGVTGPSEAAAFFADRWARVRPARVVRTTRQGLYELTSVIPQSHDAVGALRAARSEDVARVTEWLGQFARDAGLPEAEAHALPERAGSLVESGAVFLWDDGSGESVSMAALRGATSHGVRVAFVYTPPALRHRGYATACVGALSAHALASGRRFCTLYTDMNNPTSNSIYQRLGYRLLGHCLMIEFAET
jgi:predicted GNAT family acetyltransferase